MCSHNNHGRIIGFIKTMVSAEKPVTFLVSSRFSDSLLTVRDIFVAEAYEQKYLHLSVLSFWKPLGINIPNKGAISSMEMILMKLQRLDFISRCI
jgi:hypothetical protein